MGMKLGEPRDSGGSGDVSKTPNPVYHQGVIPPSFPFLDCIRDNRYLIGLVADEEHPEHLQFLERVWEVVDKAYGYEAFVQALGGEFRETEPKCNFCTIHAENK